MPRSPRRVPGAGTGTRTRPCLPGAVSVPAAVPVLPPDSSGHVANTVAIYKIGDGLWVEPNVEGPPVVLPTVPSLCVGGSAAPLVWLRGLPNGYVNLNKSFHKAQHCSQATTASGREGKLTAREAVGAGPPVPSVTDPPAPVFSHIVWGVSQVQTPTVQAPHSLLLCPFYFRHMKK